MRSQKSTIAQIKRVLFVPGGMIWRRIQSIEAVPLGFDIGTFGEGKTHSSKNLNSAFVHLMKRMQRTDLMRRSRKRDVDARQRIGFPLSTDFFSALVQRFADCVARLVEQLADERAFVFGERFHPLAPFRDAAAFPEIFYSHAFQRLLLTRSVNVAQSVVAQLFERVSHSVEALNVEGLKRPSLSCHVERSETSQLYRLL